MRYLRLYKAFVAFSLSRAMEFRLDFFFRVFMDSVFYIVGILTMRLVLMHTPQFGGWNLEQAMVFLSVFFLIDAIYMTLFSNNLWWMPFLINKGDLDYYLLRPVSSLFFLSLREFSFNSFINFIMAIGIFIWALMSYSQPFAWYDVLLLCATTVLGALMHYAMNLLFAIPVFWTHSGRGLANLFFSLSRFSERPDRIFTRWTRFALITVLPLSLIASFPARLFLDGFTWSVFAHLLGVSTLYMFCVWVFWRIGLRAYSSASS